MSATWRPIPGHPGYEVSDQGEIRSYKRSSEPRLLKPTPDGRTGYPMVRLAGSSGSLTVHSLVALAFLGPRPDGHDVRHLDGTRTNNAAANLAYGTRAENVADMLEHGTHYRLRTHCANGHPYEEVGEAGKVRICRACKSEAKRRHYLKVRDKRTTCPDCGAEVMAWSLNTHRRTLKCQRVHYSSTGSWVRTPHGGAA